MFSSIKNNAVVSLAATIWKYSGGFRLQVLAYVLLATLAAVVDLCMPLAAAELMNSVQNLQGQELVNAATKYLLILVGLELLFWCLHGPSRVIENSVAFKIQRNMQSALFRRTIEMPMTWHRDHHSGEIIDQMKKATSAIRHVSSSSFEVLHIVTKVVGALFALTWLMYGAGIAVVIGGILAIAVIVAFDRRLIAQLDTLNKRYNEVAASLQDYLTNVRTVVSLRLGRRVSDELDSETDSVYPLVVKNAITNELKWFASASFVILAQVGVTFGYIVVMVRSGRIIEFGTVYKLWRYLSMVGDSFFQFTYKYGDLVLNNTMVCAAKYIEFDHFKLVDSGQDCFLPRDWKKLEIKDLCFSHVQAEEGDEEQATLLNLNLCLERGKFYGLVGQSGGGKSTILSLIRGTQKADSANVLCDNRALPNGLGHVNSHSTLIPQEPELFGASVRFNITLGSNVSDTLVMEAVRLACFDDVLLSLSRGLDTDIAEKGVSLSGGQKQRLAVARGFLFALMSKSDIVLLDEPTSSVDPVTQLKIFSNAKDCFRDRCVVSVTHNMEILNLFDEVIHICDGKAEAIENVKGVSELSAFSSIGKESLHRIEDIPKDYV